MNVMHKMIKEDGIVAPWYRHIILGCALSVVIGHVLIFVLNIWVYAHFNHVAGFRFTTSSLLFWIPLGILFGELTYEADREVNEQQKVASLKKD